jgi:NAD(P)H dehydrogenase (quinone)
VLQPSHPALVVSSVHHAWDYDELAAVIGEIVGRPVVRRDVGSEEHVALLRSFGLDEQTAELVATIDANIRAGLQAGGSTELSTLIGRPTTTLAEGLRGALGER